MSKFCCDLNGDQQLQLWRISAKSYCFWRSDTTPYPLTIAEAKVEVENYNSSYLGFDENDCYAAFPYSPYLELELSAEWMKLCEVIRLKDLEIFR